jgi:UDPglucose--hexose-1-phosphate uridylyltransferase
MGVVFKKIKDTMRVMSPFKNFSLDEIPLEIRFDPLTGQTTRVFDLPYRPPARPDFEELVKQNRGTFCPFCPEAIEESTPRYPKDIIPDGRIRVGEACLVPNLLPLDRYTGVCILSQKHFIAIEDFTPQSMQNAFFAAQIFIKTVSERDPGVNFFNINWNHMPPAGSSMMHPHIQVNCGEIPTYQLRTQIESSLRYFLENGRIFWTDFIAAEQGARERYIADIGSTCWTLGFAPQSALPDLWCIFPNHSSLLHIENDELDGFFRGLSSAIKYFHREGLYSFNVSMFSGRENEHFRVNARISPRLLLRESGNSDQTYHQVLHREPCSMKPPESVRKKVLECFGI